MGFVKSMVVRFSLLALLCIGVGVGCAELKSGLKQAGAGAVDGIASAGKMAGHERLAMAERDGKLASDLRILGDAMVDAMPDAPAPAPAEDPMKSGPIYGLFFLLAKIGGDALKGFVRSKMAKGKSVD